MFSGQFAVNTHRKKPASTSLYRSSNEALATAPEYPDHHREINGTPKECSYPGSDKKFVIFPTLLRAGRRRHQSESSLTGYETKKIGTI